MGEEDNENKLLYSVERQPLPPLALKLWRGQKKMLTPMQGERRGEERRAEERSGEERRGEERRGCSPLACLESCFQ